MRFAVDAFVLEATGQVSYGPGESTVGQMSCSVQMNLENGCFMDCVMDISVC